MRTTSFDDRMQERHLADQGELAERIADLLPTEGSLEIRPGIFLYRSHSTKEPMCGTCEPSLCVIAQGSKSVQLGEEFYRYDPAHYLVTTMALPFMAEIVKASVEEPYLSVRLALDPAIVTSVMLESGQSEGTGGVKAVDVSPLDGNLLDATLRLVRFVQSSQEYDMLAPLVIREIIFRLLNGPQGNRMRHLAQIGGHSHRMVRAVERVRQEFDKPLRVEDVATELGMSVSGFHAHFKAATTMSPLQFQKQLRLQEARRLMLSEDLDAAEAGFRVGYEDASHFSREYKRQFGHPPIRDVERLRSNAVEAIST